MYSDQQILIHLTHQTAVPLTRHFSAKESVSTPLQLLCTSLGPLYDIETQNTVLYVSVQDMICCLANVKMFNL
jgi:hypothetical protein